MNSNLNGDQNCNIPENNDKLVTLVYDGSIERLFELKLGNWSWNSDGVNSKLNVKKLSQDQYLFVDFVAVFFFKMKERRIDFPYYDFTSLKNLMEKLEKEKWGSDYFSFEWRQPLYSAFRTLFKVSTKAKEPFSFCLSDLKRICKRLTLPPPTTIYQVLKENRNAYREVLEKEREQTRAERREDKKRVKRIKRTVTLNKDCWSVYSFEKLRDEICPKIQDELQKLYDQNHQDELALPPEVGSILVKVEKNDEGEYLVVIGPNTTNFWSSWNYHSNFFQRHLITESVGFTVLHPILKEQGHLKVTHDQERGISYQLAINNREKVVSFVEILLPIKNQLVFGNRPQKVIGRDPIIGYKCEFDHRIVSYEYHYYSYDCYRKNEAVSYLRSLLEYLTGLVEQGFNKISKIEEIPLSSCIRNWDEEELKGIHKKLTTKFGSTVLFSIEYPPPALSHDIGDLIGKEKSRKTFLDPKKFSHETNKITQYRQNDSKLMLLLDSSIKDEVYSYLKDELATRRCQFCQNVISNLFLGIDQTEKSEEEGENSRTMGKKGVKLRETWEQRITKCKKCNKIIETSERLYEREEWTKGRASVIRTKRPYEEKITWNWQVTKNMETGQDARDLFAVLGTILFEKAVVEREQKQLELRVELGEDPFPDVGGLMRVKETILEEIIYPLKYPEVYQKMNATVSKGILLTGEPGTGKTLIAKNIAKCLNANFIYVSLPDIMAKWLGESEQNVRRIFEEARNNTPSVIFFDELDSVVSRRDAIVNDARRDVVSVILQEIDGMLTEDEQIIIIGTSNYPEMIDPAMLRSGRLSKIIEIPLPDLSSRKQICKIHLKRKKLDPLIDLNDLDDLATKTEGFTGADIAESVEIAARKAARRFVVDSESSPFIMKSELATVIDETKEKIHAIRTRFKKQREKVQEDSFTYY